MIVLNLKDGLGNQLFEYAYALYLQSFYPQESIVINPFSYRAKGYKGYALPYFNLPKQVQEMPQREQRWWYYKFLFRLFWNFGRKTLSLRRTNRRSIDDAFLTALGRKGLYVSFKAFEFYPVLETKKRVKYIHGNFEHHAYIEANVNRIREELQVITPISMRDQHLISEFQRDESVCVHIRRGDYLDPKWAQLNICTYEYYNRAINYVTEKIPNSVFFIFSNTPADIVWIQENYHFENANIKYVTYGCADYEEFRLMMSCKHFIISNSTFSWWAAYLGKNPAKIVVSPSKWSKTSMPSGLILESFVKIDVE